MLELEWTLKLILTPQLFPSPSLTDQETETQMGH